MKIGIITPYDSSNLGAFMQAYALKTLLEKEKHEVYFLKIRNKKELKKLFLGDVKTKTFVSRYWFNKNKYKIFQREVNETFKVIDIENIDNENIETIIIGSDEVWNVKKEFYRKECFYGINVSASKKIAYAPSCGIAQIEDYKNYEYIKQGMKQLDAIFPRDEQTKKIVETLTGRECHTVLDPTLLVDLEEKEAKIELESKYVLVYGYSFNQKQREYIKKFAKKHNCITLSICMKHTWCDKNVNCSPLEFSDIIKKAEYVITKTFHGTIFSTLNRKKFVTFMGSQKIMDLLDKIALKERLIDENKFSYEDFERKLESIVDFDESYNIIKEEREQSIKRLKEALNK